MIVYSWYGNLYETHINDEGKVACSPIESKIHLYNANYDFWCILYLFIPACVLPILNIAIIMRLKKAQGINRSMTSINYKQPNNMAKRLYSTESAASASSQSSVNHEVVGNKLSRENSAKIAAHRNPTTQFKIRYVLTPNP